VNFQSSNIRVATRALKVLGLGCKLLQFAAFYAARQTWCMWHQLKTFWAGTATDRATTSWYFRGAGIDCNMLLYLKTNMFFKIWGAIAQLPLGFGPTMYQI